MINNLILEFTSTTKMKRTRENINYTHPNERWNLSGCLVFDGEDLGEEERKRQNQQIQKEWLKQ